MRKIWLTAFEQSMHITYFWGLFFGAAVLSRDFVLDSSLILAAALFFPMFGIVKQRATVLPFARVHSKSISEFFRFDLSLVIAVLAVNVGIAGLYCALYHPHLLILFRVMPLHLFWASVCVFIIYASTSPGKRGGTARNTMLQIFLVYVYFGIVAVLFSYSAALGFFFVATSSWWAAAYRSQHILEAFHKKLRHRMFAVGFASLTVLMMTSIGIGVARQDSFLKWKSHRAPASMGERDHY